MTLVFHMCPPTAFLLLFLALWCQGAKKSHLLRLYLFTSSIGVQSGALLPVGGRTATFGVIWGCHNMEGAAGIWWVGVGLLVGVLDGTEQPLP